MRENTKPATLFLCVAPDGKTDCVRIIRDRTDDRDFRRFIDSLLDASLQTDAPVPDDWVFRYIIPDGGLLPTLETGRDHSDYHRRLRHLDTLAGLRPTNVVALRNAALCRRSGIDPLSAEGSDRQLALGETEPRSFPSVRAVELAPNRVLLYDMSETVGCDAYRSLHQHIADHFFDREIQTETLRLYDLHSFFDTSVLMKHIPALNFNFNHYSRNFKLTDIPAHAFLNSDILKEGFLVKEYDLHPTSECYTRFCMGEDISLNVDMRAFEIALLDHISREGYPTQRLSPEWRYIFPHKTDFKDLEENIADCDDRSSLEQLQMQAREKARTILAEEYPDIRRSQRNYLEDGVSLHIPDAAGETKGLGRKV